MTDTAKAVGEKRWSRRTAIALFTTILATSALPAQGDVALGTCPQTQGSAAHPGNPVAGTWYTCDFTCVTEKYILLEVKDYLITDADPEAPGGRVNGDGAATGTSCGSDTGTSCGPEVGECSDVSVAQATAANGYICRGQALLGSIGTHLRVKCTATDSVPTGVPALSYVGVSLLTATMLALGIVMIKRRRQDLEPQQ